MDVLPVRPPPPHRPRPAAPRGAPRAAAPAHAAHPAHAAAADVPPTPEELALIAQQATFDQMMQARAEASREANALRDLMMEQLKHDDQAMRSWIKLI